MIICPARSITKMRIPVEYTRPLEQGRLLILSPFPEKQDRATAELAPYRKRFVAALAGSILVAHTEPGSKTEQLCREVIGWGKRVYTLDSAANASLAALGALPVTPDDEFSTCTRSRPDLTCESI